MSFARLLACGSRCRAAGSSSTPHYRGSDAQTIPRTLGMATVAAAAPAQQHQQQKQAVGRYQREVNRWVMRTQRGEVRRMQRMPRTRILRFYNDKDGRELC